MTMRRATTIVSVPVLVLLGGCFQDIIDDGAKLVSITEGEWDTYASSTTTGETPTTSAGEGVHTDTGDTDETSPELSTTTAPPQNTPPSITVFEVVPDHLGEAGPAELQLTTSDDVVSVRLLLDDNMLATVTPADFPRTWHAASAADNGTHEFKVIVEDAEGLTAEASDTLDVLLPASGVEKCIFEEDPGAGISMVSAVAYTHDAIVAVGARDTGAGLRMTAWKLDPNSCQPLLGWPKSPDNWSADENLKNQISAGVAVDVDADDNIVVAGNLLVNGKPQSYVARLNPGGSRLWEKTGQPGDELTSVATATGQYNDRVFVGGSRRTSDAPVRTDAAVWIYQAIGEEAFISAPTLFKAPFTADEEDDLKNSFSESVRAVEIQPGSDNAVAVGEREYKDGEMNVYRRAFTAIVHPLGAVVGTPWTSWAPALKHDALRSLAFCGENVMAGGWTRDHADPNAKPQPVTFWLADDGVLLKHRHEPQLDSTAINGIACDRAGKIVGAATRDALERDAQVFAVPGQDGARVMYDDGAPGDDSALAVACDARGFCGWGGYRTNNGKRVAVVRVHHP